jgi:hypothetical protein
LLWMQEKLEAKSVVMVQWSSSEQKQAKIWNGDWQWDNNCSNIR